MILWQERVSILIDQLKKFGVEERLLFTAEDLLEKRNIPKVARCLATCVDLVSLSLYISVKDSLYYFQAEK